jgi:hypothetical protein
VLDPIPYHAQYTAELRAEADRERLAALVPHGEPGVRRAIARICVRAATWLDGQERYGSRREPGPEDWVNRSARV